MGSVAHRCLSHRDEAGRSSPTDALLADARGAVRAGTVMASPLTRCAVIQASITGTGPSSSTTSLDVNSCDSVPPEAPVSRGWAVQRPRLPVIRHAVV